jgi:hypothetical protein
MGLASVCRVSDGKAHQVRHHALGGQFHGHQVVVDPAAEVAVSMSEGIAIMSPKAVL